MNWIRVSRVPGWALLFVLFCDAAIGQSNVPRRISGPVNDSDVTRLPDNVHPRIRHALDRGTLAAGTPLQRMSIFFKPSAAQQQELDRLLAQQQNPSSPNYHKWLTPGQYGARFGMNPEDLAA